MSSETKQQLPPFKAIPHNKSTIPNNEIAQAQAFLTAERMSYIRLALKLTEQLDRKNFPENIERLKDLDKTIKTLSGRILYDENVQEKPSKILSAPDDIDLTQRSMSEVLEKNNYTLSYETAKSITFLYEAISEKSGGIYSPQEMSVESIFQASQTFLRSQAINHPNNLLSYRKDAKSLQKTQQELRGGKIFLSHAVLLETMHTITSHAAQKSQTTSHKLTQQVEMRDETKGEKFIDITYTVEEDRDVLLPESRSLPDNMPEVFELQSTSIGEIQSHMQHGEKLFCKETATGETIYILSLPVNPLSREQHSVRRTNKQNSNLPFVALAL